MTEPEATMIQAVAIRERCPYCERLTLASDGIALFCAECGFTKPDPTEQPRIVCLCGSTRFWRTFQRASLAETMAGRIVLSIGAASGTDDEHFGNLPKEEYDRIKTRLDTLHLHKIALATEVLILNEDDYIGASTRRELEYARRLGKLVRWWVYPSQHARPGEPHYD